MASGASNDTTETSTMAPTPALTTGDKPTDKDEEEHASFISLPEELVSNIAVKLGSDDLFNLRLTCRDLEAKSLHEFATEYFGAECFMFTSESLKVLANIAKSEKLRHYLQKVYLITAAVTERQVKCCQHGNANCAWKPTVREREAYIYYKGDQQRLQKEGGDKKYLIEAFANLSRLQRLILIDQPKGLPSPLKCHGLTKFRRTTGISPSFRPVDESFTAEYYPWLSHVFRTMMLAVAESGINTIQHLCTNLAITYDSLYGLSPVTDLQFKSATLQQLSAAFNNLTDITLCLRTRSLRAGKQDSSKDLERASKSIKGFARILNNMSVTKLALNFDMGPATGPILRMLTSHVDVGKLTYFSIDSVQIDMQTLASLVCRLKEVQMLVLSLVELKDGSWIPILKALQKLPKLSHLHMQYLQVEGQKCLFLEKPDADTDEEEGDEGMIEPPWLGPLTGYGLGLSDEDDDSELWSDEDHESPPDLLDRDGNAVPQGAGDGTAAMKAKGTADSKDTASKSTCPHRTDKNHRAPGSPRSGERGYYICLEGAEEIKEQLPLFMKEYNLGGEIMDYDLGLGGLLGNLANMPPGAGAMGGMFTMAVPAPPPGPQAQAGQAQGPTAAAGQGGAATQGGQAAGIPNIPGMPPIPPGLGGLFSSLFGAYGPPPAQAGPGAPPAANPNPNPNANPNPDPTQTQTQSAAQGGSAAQAPAAHTTTTGQQDEAEEGWWEDTEMAEGELDDVD